MFARLIKLVLPPPANPELIFLDFSGIEVATASYLRESVFAFRDFVRRKPSLVYPVIANANEDVIGELLVLTASGMDAIMACSLSSHGKISNAALIGTLDSKQQLAFELVNQRGETDATELMRDFGEGLKSATGWNNRLASLAMVGLVMEISQGRSKRYRPLFAGDVKQGYGN